MFICLPIINSGAINYYGSIIDRVGLWTLLLVIVTALLCWVGWKQLGGINKTTKTDFIDKFIRGFFNETTRDMLMLFDYNALIFQVGDVKYGESTPPKRFPYFLINEDIIRQLKIDPAKLNKLLNKKVYNSFEIDDFLLGYFEDIGSFEKKALLDIEDINNVFSWYIVNIWKNDEIQKYIKQQRTEENEGEDIYDNFEYIFNKCHKKAKK